jgi:UDP-glucose 4-epimerase
VLGDRFMPPESAASSADPRPRHLLVTGARGRLATSLVPEFRALGHRVTTVSRDGGDLTYPGLLRDGLPAGVDAILHLAWSTVPATAEADPGRATTEDLPLLRSLLAAAEQAGARGAAPHFIFFSTGGAVYGDNDAGPAREEDACRPIGAYGRAKLAAEAEVLARQPRLPCAVLRISNPYGFRWRGPQPQGIIPRAFASAWSGTPLPLWGDGSARKDFLHRADFVRALDAVIRLGLAGVYNVAAGESHSVTEVLAAVERETGRPIRREPGPAQPWDVHTSRLDITRLRAATGWRPRIGLAEGIHLTSLELGKSG